MQGGMGLEIRSKMRKTGKNQYLSDFRRIVRVMWVMRIMRAEIVSNTEQDLSRAYVFIIFNLKSYPRLPCFIAESRAM
jgi:hypothetical protein